MLLSGIADQGVAEGRQGDGKDRFPLYEACNNLIS